VGVVFEADGSRGCPFGMLLGNSFLRGADDFDLLILAQFADQRAEAVLVGYDGIPDVVVRAVVAYDQVTRVDPHNVVARALGMEGKDHAALPARVFAIAISCVVELVHLARVEGDQTEAVGDELVGQHRRVDSHLYEIDGNGRHFGLNYAS
jgi:hypothetical protein